MDSFSALPLFVRLAALFSGGVALGLFIPRFTGAYSTLLRAGKANRKPNVFSKVLPPSVGFALVALYCWEIFLGGVALEHHIPSLSFESDSLEVLHQRFVFHAALFAFLLVATFIDFEEMIIPDSITIPGTIFGLFLAAAIPQGLLPATQLIAGPETITGTSYEFLDSKTVPLHLASSRAWPRSLMAAPNVFPLVFAIGIWWFWCFAMLNRVWYARLPFRKALAIFLRYLRYSPSTIFLASLAVFGTVVVYVFRSRVAPDSLHWQGFFSALVGLFGGMTLIWSVRIAGFLALKREAMGFGDVVFMGMIGAFLGWQACVFIFFLAPLVGLLVGIVRFLTARERVLPYGPYLSIAALVVLVFWPTCWGGTEILFSSGWLVPIVMGISIVLLGFMLKGWVILRHYLENLQNRSKTKNRKKRKRKT